MADPLLEGLDLRKTYAGPAPVEVLKGASLEVRAGELLAVIGPSGSGKSTLLHLLGGLDRPTGGEVRLSGRPLSGFSDRALARVRNERFGFVFQFYHLVPELTVLENVMLPGRMGGFSRPVRRLQTEAKDLLERVGLSARLDHRPRELSGGEQQRTAIARALINGPEIVFCDEPTGNLDAETGRRILELMLEFNRRDRTAWVMVTHEPAIQRVAGRVLSLRDGRLWA